MNRLDRFLLLMPLTAVALASACGQSDSPSSATADDAHTTASQSNPASVPQINPLPEGSDDLRVTVDGQEIAIDEPLHCIQAGGMLPESVLLTEDVQSHQNSLQVNWDSQGMVTSVVIAPEGVWGHMGNLPKAHYQFSTRGNSGRLGDATLTKDGKAVRVEGRVEEVINGGTKPFTIEATCP